MFEVTSSKRNCVFVNLEEGQPQKKGRKVPCESTPVSLFLKILVTANRAMCSLNCVWMNQADIEELFSNSKLNKQGAPQFVNMVNRVFKVLSMDSLPKGTLLVNFLQNEQINNGKFHSQGSDTVLVNPLDSSIRDYGALDKLVVNLQSFDKEVNSVPLAFSLESLRKKMVEVLEGKVLGHAQTLFVDINGLSYKLTVSFSEPTQQLKKLSKDTRIDIVSSPNIIIYHKEHKIQRYTGKLKCELVSVDSKNPGTLFVKEEALASIVKHSLFQNGLFIEGKITVDLNDRKDRAVILLKKLDQFSGSDESEFGYKTAYTIDENFPLDQIRIKAAPHLKTRAILVSKTAIATQIEVELRSIESFSAKTLPLITKEKFEEKDEIEDEFSEEERPDNERTRWVSVYNLYLQLKQLNYIIGINYGVPGQNKEEVDVLVKDIEPTASFAEKTRNPAQGIVDSKTVFKYIVKDKTLKLVDNCIEYQASKVVLKVKQLPVFSFFGEGTSRELAIKKDKLEAACRKALISKTYKKQLFRIDCENDKNKSVSVLVKVKDLELVGAPETPPEYGWLGRIGPTTELKFDISNESKIKLTSEKDKVTPQTILDLKDLENVVGGVSDHLKTILRKVIISRGPLKEEFKKRGLKPIKGMLLYGPPGTGKTTLARNIGKIFGCSEGERFKLLNASELTDKYVGETEKKIRELFKPAEEAQKKHGDKSELHLIVIDEADGILGTRQANSDHPWYNSWVNQFLGKIDGLHELNNVFIVLMSNRKEIIDAAVLRPGRIEMHLELSLADQEGRKQIFAIHTKTLKEANLLHDVNIDQLAEATHGFSGAEIEGVVKDAASFSMERLSKLDIPKAELEMHKDRLVTMEDFLVAIHTYRSAE